MTKRVAIAMTSVALAVVLAFTPALAEGWSRTPEATCDTAGLDEGVTPAVDVAEDIMIYAILWIGSRVLRPGPYAELLMAVRRLEDERDRLGRECESDGRVNDSYGCGPDH